MSAETKRKIIINYAELNSWIKKVIYDNADKPCLANANVTQVEGT